MERLLRPHREAANQRDPLDAEHPQQPLLHPDIVGRREMRVTAAVERRRAAGARMTARCRTWLMMMIEILGWIDRFAKRDQLFQIGVLRAA
jgi:hypothetical protein